MFYHDGFDEVHCHRSAVHWWLHPPNLQACLPKWYFRTSERKKGCGDYITFKIFGHFASSLCGTCAMQVACKISRTRFECDFCDDSSACPPAYRWLLYPAESQASLPKRYLGTNFGCAVGWLNVRFKVTGESDSFTKFYHGVCTVSSHFSRTIFSPVSEFVINFLKNTILQKVSLLKTHIVCT